MARLPRINLENGWYHLMNRGAGRRNIFDKDFHFTVFLKTLAQITSSFEVEIHSYCLMPNHYHLLMRTPHANISRAMHYLDGVYTQRYNRLVKTDGPLFRGRFKSILIDADSYLARVSRYMRCTQISLRYISLSIFSFKFGRW